MKDRLYRMQTSIAAIKALDLLSPAAPQPFVEHAAGNAVAMWTEPMHPLQSPGNAAKGAKGIHNSVNGIAALNSLIRLPLKQTKLGSPSDPMSTSAMRHGIGEKTSKRRERSDENPRRCSNLTGSRRFSFTRELR